MKTKTSPSAETPAAPTQKAATRQMEPQARSLHTPGPWINYGSVSVVTDHPNCGAAELESNRRICTLNQNEDRCSESEREANAHLIAAAPIMLEALKAARKWMGERPVDPIYPNQISAAMVIDALELAISQAEGQTI